MDAKQPAMVQCYAATVIYTCAAIRWPGVRTLVLFAALVFAETISCTIARAEIEASVTFRFDPDRVFEGFGVNTWIASPHLMARDTLLRQLNVKFIRASLPSLLPDQALPGRISVTDGIALIRRNATPRTDAAMRQFGQELQALGIKLHVIFWSVPQPWREDHGQVHLASSAHLQDDANYIAANLLYSRQQGIEPEAVELTNEPNGVWNTQFTPGQYDQLVSLTRVALDSAGLKTLKIEGPGTSNRPGDFLTELERTGDIRFLGAYSFHEYDSRGGIEPTGLRVISPAMAGAPPRPVVITEFSSSLPRWRTAPYSLTNDRTFDPDFGISVTGEALALIGGGAREILMWHLEDLPWMKGSSGLLDRAGTEKPAALALKTVFSLVTPGSEVAVPVGDRPDKIPLLGFLSGAKITVCAANLRETTADIPFTFSGSADAKLGETRFFSGRPGAPAPTLSSGHGGFLVHLPGRTIYAVRFDTGRSWGVSCMKGPCNGGLN